MGELVKVIFNGQHLDIDMIVENAGYTAEQQLWAEMLRQAMKDALHPGQYFHRDRRWFRRRATKVGSFLWVLAALNLEGAKEQIQEVVFGKSEFAEHCRYWLCRDRGGHRNRLMNRKNNAKYRHVMRAA